MHSSGHKVVMECGLARGKQCSASSWAGTGKGASWRRMGSRRLFPAPGSSGRAKGPAEHGQGMLQSTYPG